MSNVTIRKGKFKSTPIDITDRRWLEPLRTIMVLEIDVQGLTYEAVSDMAKALAPRKSHITLSSGTVRNMYLGYTQHPRFETVAWILGALGYTLEVRK